MTEELENSLLKSVETFLNERLQAIEEQLSKLQADFHEQISRVRETAAGTAVENTPLASAIAGHLQTAREQKLSGSAAPAPMDLSPLKNGIKEIQNERTQSDVLTALLRAGARFADRTVLFVVKGNQAIAWRACRANRSDVEPVSGIAASLTEDNIVGRAAQTRSIESATLAGGDGRGLIAKLGGDAQQAVAIPLVVRQKVVAVLYADSAWPHPDAIQIEALEVLERVATMAVELVSPRLAQAAQPGVPTQSAEPVRQSSTIPAATEAAAEEMPAVPQVSEAQPSEPEPEVSRAQPSETQRAATGTAEAAPVSESTEPVITETPAPETSAPKTSAPPETSAPEPAPLSPAGSASLSPQYSAPLGSSRRFGASEADLPVEVSEDERRLHNDARRFARLLVSEIKLYNEQKVSEGRSRNDLYDRLREDIDRSRQMYDKRVAPPVAARHDYFHQELVNLLAEGDAAKLGGSYPGAAVAA